MQRFRYVSHTADMAFIGYGSTLRMALENSSLALLNIMLDIRSISKDKAKDGSVTIKEEAQTHEELAWYTLQDVLSKIDSRKLNAFRFDITSIKEKGNKFRLQGKLIYKKSKADHSLLSVKAVTPHDLTVKKQNGIYAIHVVVDV